MASGRQEALFSRGTAPAQRGFTLVEAIMVIVITGVLSGVVAVFVKGPVEGYVSGVRRAELGDIADTALRRMARDLRTAVPNSLRLSSDGKYIEFIPMSAGGRYRAEGSGNAYCATGDDHLDFSAIDTCFEILGPAMTFSAGDRIFVGSTQSDGNLPYQGETSSAHIRRPYAGATGSPVNFVTMTSSARLPASAELSGSRFQVAAQSTQAVSYGCESIAAAPSGGDGPGSLRRYWAYGYNPTQATPPVGGSKALLADKLSACSMQYEARDALFSVTLQLTRAGESVRLYHEIHVNTTP